MNHPSDEARIASVQCLSPEGLHTMVYKEWGAADNPQVLICVHGLTRVSDDFDTIAQELSKHYRVICPDIVGRGRSGWFSQAQNYQIPQYVSDMVTLIAALRVPHVAFLGTSMGGLIGLVLAALRNSPVEKLIINDVGPVLDAEALLRISKYVGEQLRFATFEGGASYIRSISQTFGAHTEPEWHKFCNDVLRQDPDGMWIRHYDLNLSIPMQGVTPEQAKAGERWLWATYDAITCPTLLLRGDASDLLRKETALEMTQRGPKARLVEFANVGHAPTLVHADQIAPVKNFLLG